MRKYGLKVVYNYEENKISIYSKADEAVVENNVISKIMITFMLIGAMLMMYAGQELKIERLKREQTVMYKIQASIDKYDGDPDAK